MRDDRYRGTSLPRPVRKLYRMAERTADRVRPDLLRRQALVVLIYDARREISSDFLQVLKRCEGAPSLFDANELMVAASTGLEAEIAHNIARKRDIGLAIREALCSRGDGYAREQKCQLVADRQAYATIASESLRKACHDASLLAANKILRGESISRTSNRVQLSENLLAQPTPGADP
jgi:hypothetical protein